MLQKHYRPGRDFDRNESQKRLMWLICSLISAAIIIAISAYWWGGRLVTAYNDIGTAPSRFADGTVTGITYLAAKKADPTPGALITVSWDGKTEQYRTFSPPHANARVRVQYVVGKSGKVYIRGLEEKK